MDKENASHWFPSELGQTHLGYVKSLEATIALDIVKHCALVTAQPDGEDSVGRSKLAVMPAADVATRACDIAEAMVGCWTSRGWLKPTTMTPDQDWTEAGHLQRRKRDAEFSRQREQVAHLIRKAEERTDA